MIRLQDLWQLRMRCTSPCRGFVPPVSIRILCGSLDQTKLATRGLVKRERLRVRLTQVHPKVLIGSEPLKRSIHEAHDM